MTVRLVILGKRRDGRSHETFLEDRQDEPEALIGQIPGLSRFTVSLPLHPAAADYDEMAELYFKTEEDLRMAIDSADWQRALDDAEPFVNFDESVMFTVGDRSILYQSIPHHL